MADQDLDAELLALAGGDDSSDEEELEQTKPTETTTKAESPASSVGNSDKAVATSSSAKPGAAQKKAINTDSQATMKKTAKKGKNDESEEEGEASSASGTPNSLKSASMSESEAENSTTGEVLDEGPLYPIDNKFSSEKDKAEIMALAEVEREAILAERAQQLERQHQDGILRRLIQRYQTKDGEKAKNLDSKKRKADNADVEDVQRKSSRQKTTLGGRKVGETSDAMEAYKRQREQKGIINEQRKREGEERKERKKRGSLDRDSEADADGESEVDWNDKPKDSKPFESAPRDELPPDLHDFSRVKISRENFAKVCFYPGFDNAIKDCFARVSIGPDRVTGETLYRMCQIKAFTNGKPYAIEGANGKAFVTTQYALVTIGKSEREWPFIACSTQKITESEFQRYKKELAAENIALPTKKFLSAKINDINNLINHQFTEAEIQEKLKRSGVLKNKANALERASLYTRRKDAEYIGDHEAVAKIDAQLAVLEGPKLAFGTSLLKAALPTGIKTQQQRLADINAVNRKLNTQNVRKAQQAERRANKAQREAIARGEAVANPFARVKTYAKTHYDVNAPFAARKSITPPVENVNSSRDASPRAKTPLSITVTSPPQSPKTDEPASPSTPGDDVPELTYMDAIDAIEMDIDMSLFDHLKDLTPISELPYYQQMEGHGSHMYL